MEEIQRLIQKNERLLAINRMLIQIANAQNTSATLDELYHFIYNALRTATGVNSFYITLYDPESDLMNFVFHRDEKEGDDDLGDFKHIGLTETYTLTGELIKHEQPMVLTRRDILQRIRENPVNMVGEPPEKWIGVPLKIKGQTIGAMVSQTYTAPDLLDQRSVDILTAASEQVAIAIDRKQAEQALIRSQDQIRLLSRQMEQYSLVAASAISMSNEADIFDSICKAVTEYSDYTRVVIIRFEGEPPIQNIVSSSNVLPRQIKAVQDLNLSAEFYLDLYEKGIRFGKFSVYIPHDLINPKLDTPYEERTVEPDKLPKAWHHHDKLLVRMNNELGELIGLIAVDRPRSGKLPSDDTVRPLDIFSSLISQIMRYKKAQEALEQEKKNADAANKAKSDFLANMSHEIRTPMNAIIGMTQILAGTRLSEEQKEYTRIVEKSADALLEIINDILDFSKIEAGRLELETMAFNLRSTMEDIADLFAAKAREKQIEFVCIVSPDVPEWVTGDAGRLRQILINLVGNAMKFTHEGEISLSVHRDPGHAVESRFRFEVKDTGIGIPRDRLSKIFESFSQADTSTTRKFGGTGLGLTISKELAALMNGTIGVDSTQGKGSLFWFTALLPSTQPKEASLAAPANVGALNVLVADGHASSRKLICLYLKSWGCRFTAVRKVEEGLEALKSCQAKDLPFDLCIVHHMEPFFNGEVFGRKIRSLDLSYSLKLVLITTPGAPGDASRTKSIGFDAYLTKPIKYSQLFNCLSQTVFQKEIPANSTPDKTLITRHSLKESPPKAVRLLVVEDNPVNQKVIQKILQTFGYTPRMAANGKEAMECLEQETFDMVFMDIQMPEMDGLTATRQIRNSTGAILKPDIPIVAMTAHAMPGDREICLEAGMTDYITKPIKPSTLLEKIIQHTSGATR
mgnify:CR=1 FL=1